MKNTTNIADTIDKIKQLQKEADSLYRLGKYNQYCKIEALICNYYQINQQNIINNIE